MHLYFSEICNFFCMRIIMTMFIATLTLLFRSHCSWKFHNFVSSTYFHTYTLMHCDTKAHWEKLGNFCTYFHTVKKVNKQEYANDNIGFYVQIFSWPSHFLILWAHNWIEYRSHQFIFLLTTKPLLGLRQYLL